MAITPELKDRMGPVFLAGVIVGCALAFGGLLANVSGIAAPSIALLILCAGLSIVLGAFGSTATMRFQGLVVSGVAALCMALFTLVIKEIRNSAVLIDVSGLPRGSRVDFHSGAHQFLGADRGGDRHNIYQFVVFEDELVADVLGLTIVVPSATGEDNESELIFDCIARTDIEHALGSGQTLQWRFDDGATRKRLVEAGQSARQVSAFGPCPVAVVATMPDWKLPELVTSAMAQPADVSFAIADLKADSSPLRRDARIALAQQGVSSVRPLMDQWGKDPRSYRVRLGAVVALSEMLRSGKSVRQAVSNELAEADLQRLVMAAGEPDPTVQVYAANFLCSLADQRIVPLLPGAESGASDEGRKNLVRIRTCLASP